MPSCYADKRCDFPPAEAFVIQDRELCCQSQWAAITGAGSARNADICPWPHSSHLERGEIISTSHPESLFWDKKDIQMGFPGFSRAWCNLAHRVQLCPGALALYKDQQKSHCNTSFLCSCRVFSKLPSRSICIYSPLPAAQACHPRGVLVALERQSYTLCVPGIWEGWAEESHGQNHVQQNYFHCFFIIFRHCYTELLLSVCPSAEFVDIPCSPGPGEEPGIPKVFIVTYSPFLFWQLFCTSIFIFTVS